MPIIATHARVDTNQDDPAVANAGGVCPSHWNEHHVISVEGTVETILDVADSDPAFKSTFIAEKTAGLNAWASGGGVNFSGFTPVISNDLGIIETRIYADGNGANQKIWISPFVTNSQVEEASVGIKNGLGGLHINEIGDLIVSATNILASACSFNTIECVTVTSSGVISTTESFKVDNVQVLGSQQPAIANATDAASAVTQLNLLLAAMRVHGSIAT
jgi:hypothetical protein